MTVLVVVLMALVFVVFLNHVLDIGPRGNGQSNTTARIDVAGELLVTPDEEAHRHLRIVHLQEADSGLAQVVTLTALHDSTWSAPRRSLVGSINPATLTAVMTMLRGSELPSGFQFAVPAATASPTATP